MIAAARCVSLRGLEKLGKKTTGKIIAKSLSAHPFYSYLARYSFVDTSGKTFSKTCYIMDNGLFDRLDANGGIDILYQENNPKNNYPAEGIDGTVSKWQNLLIFFGIIGIVIGSVLIICIAR